MERLLSGDPRHERHVISTLNEREMQVEHSINFVRMGVFGFGVGADLLSAAAERLVTTQYLLFITGGTLFAGAYLALVHVLSRAAPAEAG